MARIMCPPNGIFRVFRNTLELDPKSKEKIQKEKKPLSIFSNENNTYVFNIAKTVNSVKSKESAFWRNLGVTGDIEINSPCSFSMRISQHSPIKTEEDHGWEWSDYFGGKGLTIKCPMETNSMNELYINTNNLRPEYDKLEKVCLSGHTVRFNIEGPNKIKEVTIDCFEISNLRINCPQCRRVNLPQLKRFRITNSWWSGGWCLFDHKENYPGGGFSNNMPDNCLITINSDCKILSDERIVSQSPQLLKVGDFEEISLKSFINENSAKSYVDNGNGTFTIRVDEFKLLISQQLIEKHFKDIEKAKRAWETQKEITQSMITSKKNKEKKI